MKNNYIVYMHIFPNSKRYIGITSKELNSRWKNGKGYQKTQRKMYNAIRKYGWKNIKHEILYENLTKEEAEQKEIEMITKYKTTNQKYGYNIENGGNHQGKMSLETRKRLSKSHLGYKVKEETKKKISNTLKGTRHGTSLYRMKPIDVYDKDDNFIKHYQCMADCQNEMKIRKQYIFLCCKGMKDNINGYKFKYSAK